MRYLVLTLSLLLGGTAAIAEERAQSLRRPFDIELKIMLAEAERRDPNRDKLGEGTLVRISPDVPGHLLVNFLYQQAMEVEPKLFKSGNGNMSQNTLKFYLAENYPERADEINDLFTKRLECRREDRLEIEAILAGEKTSVANAIKKIVAREDVRSKELCDQIVKFMPEEDRSQLTKELVNYWVLRPLAFPLTAKSFDITDEQRHHIRNTLEEAKTYYAKNGRHNSAYFALALQPLKTEQLRKFFIMLGKLKEDEELLDVVDRYPKELEPALTEVLGHATVSSAQ